MSTVQSQYPLSGITVIDLSHFYNGPYATFLMAMAGANVIKVEPFQGEHLRSRGDTGGAALSFAMLNSNKKPVTLNLKTEKGRALLNEMVLRADILVENFAPGVMDRLGVGAAELQKINPRLIYGSSSGYGKSGPYRDYPAMDLVMQAMSGVIASTGYPDQPPVKSGAALCDFMAGIHLYGAIMTALYEREHTGVARVVEVSMQDAIYSSLASNLGMLHARGTEAPARTGNRHGGLGVSPYNAYKTTDGYVVLNAPGDNHFRAILGIMGRSDLVDDPRFLTRTSRVQNIEAVDELIEGWTKGLTRNEVARLHGDGQGPLRSGARAVGGDGRREHACPRQPAVDRPSRAGPHRPPSLAACFRRREAARDRTEPAARRQQRGSFRRVAWPLSGRARGIQGGRRHLLSRCAGAVAGGGSSQPYSMNQHGENT